MSNETIEMPECYKLVMDLAIDRGHTAISGLFGCLEMEIDDHWVVAVNGHDSETPYRPVGWEGNCMVPPFGMAIWYQSWPAGIVTMTGGTIGFGGTVNEDLFIEAVKAAWR